MVSCDNGIQGAWSLTWQKDLGNGIINPCDVVDVSVEAGDGSVIVYGRNAVMPNTTTPIVTKDEAVSFARPILSKFPYKKADAALTVTRPNFYWEKGGPYKCADFARLAWKVSSDAGATVLVDAETGEILGGDQLR